MTPLIASANIASSMAKKFTFAIAALALAITISADDRKYSSLAKSITKQVLQIIADKGDPKGKNYNLAVSIVSANKRKISKKAEQSMGEFENLVKMDLASSPKVVITETDLTSNPAVMKIMENQQLLGSDGKSKIAGGDDAFQIAMPDFFVTIVVPETLETADIKVHKVNYSLLGAFNVDLKPVTERAAAIEAGIDKLRPTSIQASSILPPTTNYTYGPEMVNDDYFNSVWAEGSKGDGIGDYLLFQFDSTHTFYKFEIVNGFSALHKVFGDLYFLNNRVKGLRIEFEDGAETVVFNDKVKGYQTVAFNKAHRSSWAKISITSVHKGRRWDDTCIAEARFFGR